MKKLEAPAAVFALLRNDGQLFALHESEQDAIDDAVGPAFRPHYYIVRYDRFGRAKRKEYR